MLEDLNMDDLVSELSVEVVPDTELDPIEDEQLIESIATDILPDSEEDFLKQVNNVPAEVEEVTHDDSTIFQTVVESLGKLGKFVDIPEGKKFDESSFIEYFDEFTRKKAVSEIEDILVQGQGQQGIDLFNDIFVKKVPVKEYLQKFQEEQELENLKLEDSPFNQKLVMRKYLTKIGVSEEDIEEQISFAENNDKLETSSLKYKTKLVESEKGDRQKMAADKANQLQAQKDLDTKRVNDLTEVITEAIKAKSIGGIPLSLEDNATLLPYMVEKAYRLPSGQTITEYEKDYLELKKDPLKFAKLVKFVKTGLNVAPIQNQAIDKADEKVFNFQNKAKAKPALSQLEEILKIYK